MTLFLVSLCWPISISSDLPPLTLQVSDELPSPLPDSAMLLNSSRQPP
jgi:hypothetical protein